MCLCTDEGLGGEERDRNYPFFHICQEMAIAMMEKYLYPSLFGTSGFGILSKCSSLEV